MEPQFLQIGMLCASTTALGPGRRFVIWLQGCKRRCYGCASPEFQPLDGGTRISVDQLLDKIVESTDIDGLTVSGGEPMLLLTEVRVEPAPAPKEKYLSFN